MKRLIVTFALAIVSYPVAAQLSQPTPSQHRELMATRKKIMDTQRRILDLQAEQIAASAKFQMQCARFALVDHWPPGTLCDIMTAAFYEKPAQQVPPATPAKPMPTNPPPAKDEPVKEGPTPK